jgi:hypothetical protein
MQVLEHREAMLAIERLSFGTGDATLQPVIEFA